MGDISDGGPNSILIVRRPQHLEKKRPLSKGRVIVILGNHDAMILLGDNRYATAGEYAAFAGGRSPAPPEHLYMSSRQKIEAAACVTYPKIVPSKFREQ